MQPKHSAPASFHPPAIRRVRLAHGSVPLSFKKLAALLEIDVALGRREAFRQRLRRALNDARRKACNG